MAEYFISKNPMTGEVLWEGAATTQAEIDSAIGKAHQAFKSWSLLPLQQRVEYLLRFKELLLSVKAPFAETISKETGKPLWESKTEVDSMAAKVDISLDAYLLRCQELTHQLPDALSTTRHKPLGVAAVFGPYNFPGHLPNGHIIPALLAGNTVIFKPSEHTPLVGEQTIRIWQETGLPEGVMNLVQGGPDTGRALGTHQGLDALFFTGSWKTGKLLSEHYGRHPEKLLALEMGGNNPLIIGDITDIAAGAYITVQSAYLTAGQRCTCARRLILIDSQNSAKFLEHLTEMIKGIKVGAYTEDPEPFMGPVINQHAADQLLKAQDDLEKNGGVPIIYMRRIKSGIPLLSPGLIDVTDSKVRSDEELFGPILQLIRVPSIDEAIKEANRTSYGLAASILTNSRKQYELFLQKSCSGVVNWNRPTTGASSAAPFGGIGRSGNHRPSAFFAADYCSYPVASLEANALKLPIQTLPGIPICQ